MNKKQCAIRTIQVTAMLCSCVCGDDDDDVYSWRIRWRSSARRDPERVCRVSEVSEPLSVLQSLSFPSKFCFIVT